MGIAKAAEARIREIAHLDVLKDVYVFSPERGLLS